MLQMMEKYANNLEELVEEKTHQHMEEKKKADMLLYSMMPVLVITLIMPPTVYTDHRNRLNVFCRPVRPFIRSSVRLLQHWEHSIF